MQRKWINPLNFTDMKKILLLLCVAMLACLMPSCKNNDSSEPSGTGIAGKWKWTFENGYWLLTLPSNTAGEGKCFTYYNDPKEGVESGTQYFTYVYDEETSMIEVFDEEEGRVYKQVYEVTWVGTNIFYYSFYEDGEEYTYGPFKRQ